jgi:hypothetical protein
MFVTVTGSRFVYRQTMCTYKTHTHENTQHALTHTISKRKKKTKSNSAVISVGLVLLSVCIVPE